MIGAIVPSSPSLGAVMSAGINPHRPATVVELGPGTGAVSVVIQDKLAPGSRHIVVELDPELAHYLRTEYPALEVVEGDAAGLADMLATRNIHGVDAIVCSLPWTLFPGPMQHRILRAICASLGPDGCFTTFSYTHTVAMKGARRFRSLLGEYFSVVATSKTVWKNIPPARVFLCRNPR